MRISDWSSDVCSSDLRLRQLLALPADVHADAGAERIVARDLLDLAHRGAKVDVAQVGRDDRHPYLVGSVDLAGTDGLDHVGHRVQGHRARAAGIDDQVARSEEHTSELQSLMRITYAVFCLKKKP